MTDDLNRGAREKEDFVAWHDDVALVIVTKYSVRCNCFDEIAVVWMVRYVWRDNSGVVCYPTADEDTLV